MNCNRERTAQWLSEKRLQKQPHDFEWLEAEIHGAATKTAARNHDTATQNKARARGGTEPGTTRFRDGRKTTRPPAPRWDPGAPTAELRPQGPSRKSAQIQRVANFAILAAILDLSCEADLAACGKRAGPKTNPREEHTHYGPTLKYILRS